VADEGGVRKGRTAAMAPLGIQGSAVPCGRGLLDGIEGSGHIVFHRNQRLACPLAGTGCNLVVGL
jgi:hypothetical protein